MHHFMRHTRVSGCHRHLMAHTCGAPGAEPRLWLGYLNGAKETRTPDPLHAMQVLYQLSYGPVVSKG